MFILEAIFSFPTVIWTVPMAVALVFWGLALLGAVGMDSLDVDADGDLDVDFDADVDADVSEGIGIWHHLGDALALGQVPLTLVLTMISTFGWTSSFLLELFVGELLRESIGAIPYAITAFALIFLGAVFITSKAVRPLRPLFAFHTIKGHQHLVGKIATVTSSRVTDSFGTASVPAPDGSGPLLLNVVTTSEYAFVQDEEAVILDYDEQTSTYFIAPLAMTALGELDAGIHAAAESDRTSAPSATQDRISQQREH